MIRTVALFAGLGCAAGLLQAARALLPARPSLADQLAQLTTPQDTPADARPRPSGPIDRLGVRLAAPLARCGLPLPATRRHLAVLERSPQRHLAAQAALTLAGAATAVLLLALATSIGAHPSPLLAVSAIVSCACVEAAVPTLTVRVEATQRRADISHVLAAWLDVVATMIAGGAGVEQALAHAAGLLTGPAAAPLRVAVRTSQLAGRPPWVTLGQVGERLGVPALVETAATLSLAGDHGARARAALAARAATLRAHQAAAAHAAAVAATERMAIPVALLTLAVLAAVCWPSLSVVLLTL